MNKKVISKLGTVGGFFSLHKKVAAAGIIALFMFSVGTIGLFEYLGTDKTAPEVIAEISPEPVIAEVEVAPLQQEKNFGIDSVGTNLVALSPPKSPAAGMAFNLAVTPLVASKIVPEPAQGQYTSISYLPSLPSVVEKTNLDNPFDIKKTVYTMRLDGKAVANFENPDDARTVIDSIVEQKTEETSKLIKVEYKENVDIQKEELSFLAFENYSDVSETIDLLMTGTKEKREYSVQAGDIPETIAESHGMTIEELESANPEIVDKGHLLQIGQKLNLIVPVPMLNIVTTEKQEYKDQIAYETIEEEDPDLYEGETLVRVAGVEGERQVVAEVERENGIEVSRTIITEEILSEPTSEVLSIGTKPAPPKKGTGVFDVPVSRGYVITSEFGPRWGGMHTGIDLASPTGTPILAADGGEVILSGWDGNYGYAVVIDHGGNIKTKYAHCSALYVVEGEKVFKGQHIADIGTTGRSTGPHLHFEVIKNGVFMNPRYYIFSD